MDKPEPGTLTDDALQDKLEDELFEEITRLFHTKAWCGMSSEGVVSTLACCIAFVTITACRNEAARQEIRDLMPEMIFKHQVRLLSIMDRQAAAKRARNRS